MKESFTKLGYIKCSVCGDLVKGCCRDCGLNFEGGLFLYMSHRSGHEMRWKEVPDGLLFVVDKWEVEI